MRSNDERIKAMHERAADLRKAGRLRMSAAAAFSAVLLISVFLPTAVLSDPASSAASPPLC